MTIAIDNRALVRLLRLLGIYWNILFLRSTFKPLLSNFKPLLSNFGNFEPFRGLLGLLFKRRTIQEQSIVKSIDSTIQAIAIGHRAQVRLLLLLFLKKQSIEAIDCVSAIAIDRNILKRNNSF